MSAASNCVLLFMADIIGILSVVFAASTRKLSTTTIFCFNEEKYVTDIVCD